MSKNIQLSSRGFKLLVSTAPVTVLGLVLRDPLLLAVVIGVWLYTALSYYQVNKILSNLKRITIKPEDIEATLTAGSLFQEPLVIESSLNTGLEIYSSLNGASVEPTVFASGSNLGVFSFNPALSGTFIADSLRVSVGDHYCLVRGLGEVDFPVIFTVYPRVYPLAVRAVQFLAESGYLAEGEYSTLLRGRGLEYAETREYVPGDPLSMFDWKAMARTGTPYVKQFYREGGGGFQVVYDGGAPDPVSLDELNTGFLGLVLAVAEAGAPLRLGVLEGGEVTVVASDPIDSVRAALGICLREKGEEFREYYRLIEPLRVRDLDHVYGDVWDGSSPQDLMVSQGQQVIVVSCLCGDPVPLLRLLEGSRGSGAAVLSARGPWVWAPSLGKSLIIYGDAEKKTRILSMLGVGVFSSLEDMARYIQRTVPIEISRK